MDAKLAAIIVHDLKNALGALEGELHGLTTELQHELALHAYQTCVSLREKLIGFLTLYKASSQGLNARIEAVSPQDFLDALLKQSTAGRPDLRISLDTTAMPSLGFFDENLVGLALEAALQNATRFAHSSIVVTCANQEGALVFSIRDDGPGLGTKEDTPSTGLGMELCEAIANAHCKGAVKGSVVLGNRPEGGALFELRLP